MRLVTVLALLAAGAALAACAPVSRMPEMAPAAVQAESDMLRRLVIGQNLADVERLHRIVYPVLAANAALCGARVTQGVGFNTESRFDYPPDYRAASEAMGLGDGLSVVAVAPNSPAARAGIERGDRVISVNGVAVTPGARAHKKFAGLLKAADHDSAVAMVFDRAGARRLVSAQSETVCDIPSRVAVNEEINASTDGDEVVVTTGLLRFLASDDEAAVVVGHEIAHNILGHAHTPASYPSVAAMFDFFSSGWGVKPKDHAKPSLPISQAYEAEADYVGLYLIARAGFPTAAAAKVYRRFAVSAPTSIEARVDSSHPSSPARVVMLDQTAREIEAKRVAGVPLLPERKPT